MFSSILNTHLSHKVLACLHGSFFRYLSKPGYGFYGFSFLSKNSSHWKFCCGSQSKKHGQWRHGVISNSLTLIWLNLEPLIYLPPVTISTVEAYLEPCQAFKMDLFPKLVNRFQPLTIFAESSMFSRVLNTPLHKLISSILTSPLSYRNWKQKSKAAFIWGYLDNIH